MKHLHRSHARRAPIDKRYGGTSVPEVAFEGRLALRGIILTCEPARGHAGGVVECVMQLNHRLADEMPHPSLALYGFRGGSVNLPTREAHDLRDLLGRLDRGDRGGEK
jgi:hypothetical protein